MRKWIPVLFYAVIAALLILVWESIKSFKLFKGGEVTTSHHIVLKEVTELGKLELVKYSYRDIVEQSIARQFLPDPKAILIIHGEAVGCIDLRKVKADDIALAGDTLVVNLPLPEICYYKIDHSRSKVYHTEYAFMNEGLLLEEAWKRAEQQILRSALESDILEQAKSNAQLVIKPLLENASGKTVVLRYPLGGELLKRK